MFGIAWQVLDEYQKTFGDSWKIKTADSTDAWPYLPEALGKYQVGFQAEFSYIVIKGLLHVWLSASRGPAICNE